jgi:hypothetical protein
MANLIYTEEVQRDDLNIFYSDYEIHNLVDFFVDNVPQPLSNVHIDGRKIVTSFDIPDEAEVLITYFQK